MTRTLSGIIGLAFVAVARVVLAPSTACAQNFFGGGVAAYDPEISVVSSGVVMDVRGTVSADRKYVTIGAQASDNRVLALHNFQIASAFAAGPAQGFVGGVNPSGMVAGSAGGAGGPGGGSGASNAPAGAGQTANARASRLTARAPNPDGGGGDGDGDEMPPGMSSSPAEIERRAVAARSVLNQRGTFLLAVN